MGAQPWLWSILRFECPTAKWGRVPFQRKAGAQVPAGNSEPRRERKPRVLPGSLGSFQVYRGRIRKKMGNQELKVRLEWDQREWGQGKTSGGSGHMIV